MKSSLLLSIALIICSRCPVNAQVQKKPNTDTLIQTGEITFEKVYLHLDRSTYISGEDIWFKAYLVDANSNQLIVSSNCLHVELISPELKIIAKENIQLINGTGHGDYKLSDTLRSGIYMLRAYTNWMRNFGEQCFFIREIELRNSLKFTSKYGAQNNKENQGLDLQFFPEGGSLIEDVSSVVGFKATDEDGLGCDVSGTVINSANDTVLSFRSTHLGMGSFTFKPVAGMQYFAVGKTKGKLLFRIQLPVPLKTGYNLKVTENDSLSFKMRVLTNLATLQQRQSNHVYLRAASRKLLCLAGELQVFNTVNTFFLPKDKFPEGITRLTLFDELYRPQSERLFYVHKKNSVHFSIKTDKKEYAPGERVILNITALDDSQQPVMTNLSVAVTDLNLTEVDHPSSTIVSYLLLESDIRGRIEQASWYFDTITSERFSTLDNLLLTKVGGIFYGNNSRTLLFGFNTPWRKNLI